MTTTVQLDDEVDLEGFRSACRRLLAVGVAPGDVTWQVATASEADLFGAGPVGDESIGGGGGGGEAPMVAMPDVSSIASTSAASASTTSASAASPSAPRVPSRFVALCREVVLHRDPNRFGLLYRLLWRLTHEPALRGDPLDPDRLLAEQMAHAVRRDQHKMTAFVRFRRIEPEVGVGTAPMPEAEVLHVAWFEPAHHIVEATAPFFARRFAQMRWAILTPERCVRWDGHDLRFGPGAKRDDAPAADAGESLWLTYYQSIFNPARLKLAMMTKEMPRRYWHNLPEARFISSLTAEAALRSAAMIEAPASVTRRRVVPVNLHASAAPAASASLSSSLSSHSTESPSMEPSAPPATLADLKLATDRCRECPIGAHATQSVTGEGPAQAALMVVGEQPGDQEDLRGRPFVGPAGKLFDRALAQLGWSRDALFVTNAVRHFKYELRGQRRIHKTPAQQEAAACLHWLEREIELVQPKAIVALGATAARSLIGTPVAVTRERGQWLQRADGRRVLVTLHPSALLRMEPTDQRDAFDAWLADLRKATEVVTA